VPGHAPVFMYRWECPSPAGDGEFGAAHAMDVPACFYNDRDAMLGGPSAESRRMCDSLDGALLNFARHAIRGGRPYAATRATMVFGAEQRLVADPEAATREFWSGMPGPARPLG
jgi:para-nitrobenzyl esterase